MGSPLGPLFSEFYMSHIENTVFKDPSMKPDLYVRYVDDIFIRSAAPHMLKLRHAFETASVLKFTYEMPVDNKIPFLDVLVSCQENITTSVYHKPTDMGVCLHANSECPERYKKAVLTSYLKRAYGVSSSWDLFNAEIMRIKQVLVNNGYSNSFVDKHVKHFLDKVEIMTPHDSANIVNVEKCLYYRNQFTYNYRQDERVLRNIVFNNVIPSGCELKLVIYYKSMKTSNFVMRNNLAFGKQRTLAKTNLVYEFNCPIDGCSHLHQTSRYIGMTTCCLSRRLSYHLQNGAIQEHFLNVHGPRITRDQIVQGTTIRFRESDVERLRILEALIIKQEFPSLNNQETGANRILKLYR